MNLRPISDKIVIRRIEAKKMTEGGLHLPDVAVEKTYRGRVLAVGPGEYDRKTGEFQPIDDIQEGDEVMFARYAGHEQVDVDENIVIIQRHDVLAVVNPEGKEKKTRLRKEVESIGSVGGSDED